MVNGWRSQHCKLKGAMVLHPIAIQRGKPIFKLLIAAQFNNNNKRHLDEIKWGGEPHVHREPKRVPGSLTYILVQKSQSISLRGGKEGSQKALKTQSTATFKLNISVFLLISLPFQRQLLLNVQMLMEQAYREGSQAKYLCPGLAFLLDCSISFVQCFPACIFLLITHGVHPNSSWFLQQAPPALGASKCLWFPVIRQGR